MKLIINIPEQAYNLLNSDEQIDWLGAETLLECIARGTPYEERPVGHWIEHEPGYYQNPPFTCSECGNPHLFVTPYCEICGADMRSAQNLNYADSDTAQDGLASAT